MSDAPTYKCFELTLDGVATVRRALEAYDEALRLKIGRLQAIRNGQPIKDGDAWIGPTGQHDRRIEIGEDELLAVIGLSQARARALAPLLEQFGGSA